MRANTEICAEMHIIAPSLGVKEHSKTARAIPESEIHHAPRFLDKTQQDRTGPKQFSDNVRRPAGRSAAIG
jgi:hypothetical protein